MKQYVIDEFRIGDYEKVKAYLEMNFGSPDMGNIFWIPLDEENLGDAQKGHEECRPFYFAAELDSERMCLVCELLIRTKNKIRCSCIAYADENQRNWLVRRMDDMLETLEISV